MQNGDTFCIPTVTGPTIFHAYFVHTKDFSVKVGIRNGSHVAEFCDCFDSAPEDVCMEMLSSLIESRSGKSKNCLPKTREYLQSPGFISLKRTVYLERQRTITCTSQGKVYDLEESLERVLDTGLIDERGITNALLSWTRLPTTHRLGFCNCQYRIIGISPILDNETVPVECLDQIMYHECLHMAQGPFQGSHDKQFKKRMRMYPGYEKMMSRDYQKKYLLPVKLPIIEARQAKKSKK